MTRKRALSKTEVTACLLMATGKLRGGESRDSVKEHLVTYLVARGWSYDIAAQRANEVLGMVRSNDAKD